MLFVPDWCEDYLEYRQEKGLGEVDPDLTRRLAGLLVEYRRRMDHGELREASAMVQWLVPPTSFILRDPRDDSRYECIQTADGQQVRVVSGYGPEEVELEPREMPEVSDAILALVFADRPPQDAEAESPGLPDSPSGEASPDRPDSEPTAPTGRNFQEPTAG